ncbi:gliding motility-associated C-terminal domain-containing protein [Mucilaginibacter sp. ZT4R22]|uniref:Gliding motility-associated C-terminal domain-containing protein n=1 Tax=Mucilaginibacter pankratovii TaxID=2772110 RepID=A0ABR7WRC0_9SPHI|nr:gliding motility-associated C-terminal domain-containing protein [Mucilaginibacter pankratovii]
MLLLFIFLYTAAYAQDVDLYLSGHILPGKSIIKISRDGWDQYMWILAENNEVYRLNTVTQQLEDLSPKFSQYSAYHLFDIAGFYENTVALAGRAGSETKIITYDDGVYGDPAEFLNAGSSPLEGNMVGIGAASIGTNNVFGQGNSKSLLIATDQTLYHFSIDNSGYTKRSDEATRIFAANYRTQLFTKLAGRGINAPGLIGVLGTTRLYIGGSDGALNNVLPFPDVINTAYFTANRVVTGTINDYNIPDLFWGTNNGMYQRKLSLQNPYDGNYKHYLDNVKINHITDIYGFMPLGNDVAKENLLIGTDEGLYYSSSVLNPQYNEQLDDFTLYHFDKLGNIKIKFIEVSASSLFNPICENAIYLATDDGIYMVRPDYVPHTDVTKPINAIHFAFDTEDVTEKTVCDGEPVKVTLNQDITANAIQWFKDGKEILNVSGSTISLTQSGEYTAVLFDPCGGVHVESKPLHLTVVPAPVITFNYPDKLPFCDKNSVTLTTVYNPDYQYRWVANDNLIPGETSNTFTATYNARYRVEVSNCSNIWVLSKEVKVDFIHLPTPQVTAAKTTYCEGEFAPLSVDVPLDDSYTINWYKDGVLISDDIGLTAIFATTTGSYSVTLKSTIADCTQPSPPVQLSFISAPVFTFNYDDKLQFCDVASTILKTDENAAYQYRWYKDGVLNGQTTSSLTVTQSGKYKVELSACTNTWFASKEVQVDLINLPVPVVTANKTNYCEGEEAILSLNTPVAAAYTINWYKDGVLLPANNNLASIKVTIAGSYSAILNSTIANCSRPSAPVAVAFTPAPVFTFNYPAEIHYCSGTPVTLKAEGSAAYQYRWYKDGVLTGDVSPSLPVTRSGLYKIEVSSCAGSWVAREVTVNFIQLPAPVIVTDKPGYCIGDNALLSIAAPVNASYTINWYYNGELITDNTNHTSINTSLGGAYSVTIVNNTANTDGSICSVNSVIQPVPFETPPVASVEQIVRTTLCEGQLIGLVAHHDKGTVKWSTGETTDQISVRSPGVYSFTVTTAAGCQVNASVKLDLLPQPVFSVQDTSVCGYKQQTITLKAPPGFTAYAWNGVPGSDTYNVSRPQTVSLTVTDMNGCQATKQIVVASQCPDVIIPNTFTPNNDGANDAWAIGGLENDRTVTVKVLNRNGNEVYSSKGYGVAWNGQYHGVKLPAGTYYYIITAKSNSNRFSGFVTILY